MPTYAVKLFFKSPLHLGDLGLGMEESEMVIHSDTLYCTIYQAWLRIHGVDGTLPVKISSAFPFVDDVYYLPKPGIEPPGFNDTEIREAYAKPVKSTAYLSHATFKKWINGQHVDYELMERETGLLERNVHKQIRPRAKIDRINNSSVLYHIGEVSFTKNRAGLYFIVQCPEEIFKKLQGVMRLISDEGFGGERSSGYGRFEVDFIKEFTLPQAEDGERFISLSLYYPASQDEFRGAMSSYQLKRRGGWVTETGGNFPHKSVFMFSEGSVFYKEVDGGIADVAPPGLSHPVYRYGKAFLVKAR